MSKKEEFKEFAKKHPELIKYVQNGKMTWQDFYEMYDIYGENQDSWKNYLNSEDRQAKEEKSSGMNLKDIPNIIKNIDMTSIQKHINTAQKALGFIQELTTKSKGTSLPISKGPTSTRPINKFFED